ncbi:hypothetical protein KIN20_006470 [Parelaphostrongylus tenuis]|uniref:Uncharacterized protein n=1 Tax=Parelaphostrongylus tenuis TaxID=148309 RepID=A0AAD5QGQ2_PARTN|nr:hypothetical protein KIN20_006470 [Parelaphostrongylus tenuis]
MGANPKVGNALRKKPPKRLNVGLLQINARPHIEMPIRPLLEKLNWTTVLPPPYNCSAKLSSLPCLGAASRGDICNFSDFFGYHRCSF